LKESMALNIK